jgi:leucyl aminopeptidase
VAGKNLVGIVFGLLMASGAIAAVPGQRLIETAPGQRAWLGIDEIARLSAAAHDRGACGGFMDVTEHPNVPHMSVLPFSTFRLAAAAGPTLSAVVDPLMPELSPSELQANVTSLSNFQTRYYKSQESVKAADWIKKKFEGYATGRNDIQVSYFSHSFVMPSIIARIEGTGPHKNERVILGAHGDSIVSGFLGLPNPLSNSPGADDDASGVSTLIEIFRVVAQSGFRPDRSIEFMVYAGEEAGLLGSQDIANEYRRLGHSVAAVLQLDMTMYPGPGGAITFVTDNTDASLNSFTQALATTYVQTNWRTGSMGMFASSDHASWAKAGFPAVFPTEGASMREINPNLHTTRDTLSHLNMTYGMHFARLGLAFAIETAGKP